MSDDKQAGVSEEKSTGTPANPDNEWFIGPIGGGAGVIGYVETIHGAGGRAVPDYVPTRHELEVVARHWIRALLDIETFWFETGQTGSTEIRKGPYANMRLGRIADAVGEATVREIWKQEEAVERRKMGERRWRIFTEGSHEEWEQIRDETYSASTSSDPLWGVAYSRVQELATTEFADLPAREFAGILRSAADAVEGKEA